MVGSERRFVIILYNFLLMTLVLIGSPLLLLVVLISAKRRKTLFARLGLNHLSSAEIFSKTRKTKKEVVWIHALSVGEVLAAIPLVKKMKNRMEGRRICFSISTLTGFDVATENLTGVADAIFFFPYDLLFLVKAAASRVNPSLVVIVETDLWPNFLSEMSLRKVPVVLINARLSKKSFNRHRLVPFFIRWIFSGLTRICVPSALDAEKFQKLGIASDRLVVTGNIKFDQTFDPVSAEQIETWRHKLKIAPEKNIFLAGSTHNGEETIIRDAFVHLRRRHEQLVLIIAPRDPKRADSVARLFQQVGISTAFVSIPPGHAVDVLIVDTIGDLRTLYGLADLAFIGGSLVDCGGHNPLEAAAVAKPVLFGPEMSDFTVISRLLLGSGGAIEVHNGVELSETIDLLLQNRVKAVEMGLKAYEVFRANKGAVDRNMEVILNELL